MRFTREQYEKAIANLTDAMTQIEPHVDGNYNHCAICHDSGHLAWECGHNPLLAMALCEAVEKRAGELHDEIHALEDREANERVDKADWIEGSHEFLHYLSGHDSHMGVQQGPARVVLP